MIAPFEDAEDYHLFEAAVTVDFNLETAVERELVLRLASLSWRLRRASSIETGIFQNPTEMGSEDGQTTETERDIPHQSSPPRLSGTASHGGQLAECTEPDCIKTVPRIETDTQSYLATRFLHPTAADKGAFERLGRYETALWRQLPDRLHARCVAAASLDLNDCLDWLADLDSHRSLIELSVVRIFAKLVCLLPNKIRARLKGRCVFRFLKVRSQLPYPVHNVIAAGSVRHAEIG